MASASAPLRFFDSESDLDQALAGYWDMSPDSFTSAVVDDHTSVEVFEGMLRRMSASNTSAEARLLVATGVVRTVAKLASVLDDIPVDDDSNDALVEHYQAMRARDEERGVRGRVIAIPTWRLAAMAARAAMERRAAAVGADGGAIRAEFNRDIAAQLHAYVAGARRRSLSAIEKARVLLRGVTGDNAILICVCTGVMHSIMYQDDRHWRARVDYWIQGMRRLFGPTLARCSPHLLSRLRTSSLVTVFNDRQSRAGVPDDLLAVYHWFRRRLPDTPIYMQGHVQLSRDDDLSREWDDDLRRIANASNSAMLLMRGIHTADGHLLHRDAAHAIATMISPDVAYSRS